MWLVMRRRMTSPMRSTRGQVRPGYGHLPCYQGDWEVNNYITTEIYLLDKSNMFDTDFVFRFTCISL